MKPQDICSPNSMVLSVLGPSEGHTLVLSGLGPTEGHTLVLSVLGLATLKTLPLSWHVLTWHLEGKSGCANRHHKNSLNISNEILKKMALIDSCCVKPKKQEKPTCMLRTASKMPLVHSLSVDVMVQNSHELSQ